LKKLFGMTYLYSMYELVGWGVDVVKVEKASD
jgi:hypothetical protein